MTIQITGVVKSVSNMKVVNNRRTVKSIVLLTEEDDPQPIGIIFRDEKISLLEGVNPCDRITVYFSIRGREWYNSGTYKTHVFTTLDGENVIKGGKTQETFEDYDVEFNLY